MHFNTINCQADTFKVVCVLIDALGSGDTGNPGE